MNKKLISKCCHSKVLIDQSVEGMKQYKCLNCHYNCEVIEEQEEEYKKCDYCEGLGYRTESIENDIGSGDIEQVECPKCKGRGFIGNPTPSDTFIENKMKEFDEEFYGYPTMDRLKAFLKSSLQERDEMWRKKIEECLKTVTESNAIIILKQLLK